MQQYTLFQASAGKQTFNIPAFGGRLDVSWDPDSQVTQWGGLAYFVSYLKTSGLFDRLTHRHRCQLVEHLLRLTSTHLKARDIESSLMRIGEFMKRISAIAELLDFNHIWDVIILAAFGKWLGGNRTKGLLPEPLALIG